MSDTIKLILFAIHCTGSDQYCCLSKVKKLSILFFLGICWLPSFAQDLDSDSSRIVEIRDIHIVGNKKTKERIITRELSVEKGEKYALKQLVDTLVFSRNLIYNTNLFNEVNVTVQEIGGGQADLLVAVSERWYFYPLPIFKLADRNFNDWWVNQDRDFNRVKYGIKLNKFNARGRNEKLSLVLQSGFEQRFKFNYRIPYIDKKQRHGLIPEFLLITNNNLGFKTEDHLRTFLEGDKQLQTITGGSLIHRYRKSLYDYHFLGIGIASTQIADTIASLNPNYFGDGRTRQKSLSMFYGYQNDQRNNINYPTSGHNILFTITKSGLGAFDDINYWTLEGKFAKYSDLGKGFSLGNSVSGNVTDGIKYFYNYGGLGFLPKLYVRGYELDLIEGQSYLLTKNSVRKLIWKHKTNISKVMPIKQFQTLPFAFYGKLFFDGGYVKSFEGYENNNRLTDKFIYGLGAGIDMVTMYDLVIRFEYSTNRDGENQFFLNFFADL